MNVQAPIAPALIALAIASVPGLACASVRDDTVDIDHLVAAYHQAVVDHDAQRLTALFVPEGGAWFSVLTDEGLRRTRTRKPDAARLRPGSAAAFAQLVASKTTQLDPRHADLKIWSDGAIASLTFEFRFLIDGREQNRGGECWQLVKGDDGWRIASIVYSSTPPEL